MKFTPEKIAACQQRWATMMQESWGRGTTNLEIVELGLQNFAYDNTAFEREELVFNLCNKYIKEAQANAKDIDLSLNLTTPFSSCPTDEKKDYTNLIYSIMLDGKNSIQIQESLDKVISYGQSVLFVTGERENDRTLNKKLVIRSLKDPSKAFFDMDSNSPTFNDGRYCGYYYDVSIEEYKKYYGTPAALSVTCKSVTLFDFWYKSQEKSKFILLETGEYKREDIINSMCDKIASKSYANKIQDEIDLALEALLVSYDQLTLVL